MPAATDIRNIKTDHTDSFNGNGARNSVNTRGRGSVRDAHERAAGAGDEL